MMYRTETYGGLTTTFRGDFDIADAFGADAVKDTFERAFAEWGDDIRYLTNLSMVMNEKCWDKDAAGDEKLSDLYCNFYYRTRDKAYGDDFTREEQRYYFEATD